MMDVRGDFPYLGRMANGKPIIYLDSAATTQKPQVVIDTIQRTYASGMANVHRAVNFLTDEVTEAFEGARQTIARFIGAQSRQVIFTSNSTQAISYVCNSLKAKGRPLRVLATTLEHHSNFLPWLKQGSLELLPWREDGQINLGALAARLVSKPDLVTIATASNFLGTLQPIGTITEMCRDVGVPVMVDASQSIAHQQHDVQELGCDYLVFSGHKVYGPSGTGVLYVGSDIIEQFEPTIIGGGMVKEVHAGEYIENDIPYRFEAGTPNIEGVIGLAAAVTYLTRLGYEAVSEHELELIQHTKTRLSELRAVILYGPEVGHPCAPLASFQVKGLEASAVAKILGNRSNVIVRSGFHCTQPAHDQLGIGPTIRASLGIYNKISEIDTMVDTLETITEFL